MAKTTCERTLGGARYHALKIEKNYNVIRLLYFIENQLYIALKKHTINQRAQKSDRNKQIKKALENINFDEEAGYPMPSDKEQNKATAQNCCCISSTDVDKLEKSKKNPLVIEGKWT